MHQTDKKRINTSESWRQLHNFLFKDDGKTTNFVLRQLSTVIKSNSNKDMETKRLYIGQAITVKAPF